MPVSTYSIVLTLILFVYLLDRAVSHCPVDFDQTQSTRHVNAPWRHLERKRVKVRRSSQTSTSSFRIETNTNRQTGIDRSWPTLTRHGPLRVPSTIGDTNVHLTGHGMPDNTHRTKCPLPSQHCTVTLRHTAVQLRQLTRRPPASHHFTSITQTVRTIRHPHCTTRTNNGRVPPVIVASLHLKRRSTRSKGDECVVISSERCGSDDTLRWRGWLPSHFAPTSAHNGTTTRKQQPRTAVNKDGRSASLTESAAVSTAAKSTLSLHYPAWLKTIAAEELKGNSHALEDIKGAGMRRNVNGLVLASSYLNLPFEGAPMASLIIHLRVVCIPTVCIQKTNGNFTTCTGLSGSDFYFILY